MPRPSNLLQATSVPALQERYAVAQAALVHRVLADRFGWPSTSAPSIVFFRDWRGSADGMPDYVAEIHGEGIPAGTPIDGTLMAVLERYGVLVEWVDFGQAYEWGLRIDKVPLRRFEVHELPKFGEYTGNLAWFHFKLAEAMSPYDVALQAARLESCGAVAAFASLNRPIAWMPAVVDEAGKVVPQPERLACVLGALSRWKPVSWEPSAAPLLAEVALAAPAVEAPPRLQSASDDDLQRAFAAAHWYHVESLKVTSIKAGLILGEAHQNLLAPEGRTLQWRYRLGDAVAVLEVVQVETKHYTTGEHSRIFYLPGKEKTATMFEDFRERLL